MIGLTLISRSCSTCRAFFDSSMLSIASLMLSRSFEETTGSSSPAFTVDSTSNAAGGVAGVGAASAPLGTAEDGAVAAEIEAGSAAGGLMGSKDSYSTASCVYEASGCTL